MPLPNCPAGQFAGAAHRAGSGGQFRPGLVLFGRSAAYGIGSGFEWCWFPVRAVITPETAKVPTNLRRLMRRGELEARYDRDFEAIGQQCQKVHGPGWLTGPPIDVYREVHRLGFITSVGMYRAGRLVSGIWGVELGRVFSAVSMFHLEDGAGALLLGELATAVVDAGRWSVVDFGALNPNFARYGARGDARRPVHRDRDAGPESGPPSGRAGRPIRGGRGGSGRGGAASQVTSQTGVTP